MKKKILCGLLFLASVFGFGLLSSLPAVATSGTIPINITENWNSYDDQTGRHDNISDGAVSIPHNLLNVDPNFLKSISYSRFQTGSLNIGDSSNLYNTISVKVLIQANGSPGVDPNVVSGRALVWGTLYDSDNVAYSVGNDPTGLNNCVYVASSSQLELTCSITLQNYKTLSKFDIRLSGGSASSSSSLFYAYAGGSPVVLRGISVSYSGSQDPNVALNEQRNALLSQINSAIISADHYDEEVARENAKEAELNRQKGDLGVSANNTGNPFDNLFNATGCQALPTISSWFGRSDVLEVCSPYPSTIGGVIKFVGSALVVGLLIRLYYKRLKGGYNG